MTSKEKNLGINVTSNVLNWWSKQWQSHKENIQIICVALLLALFIRAFVAEPRYIPSDSMFPTLQINDRLVVEKLSYHFQQPITGDIIVFSPPKQLRRFGFTKDQAFIKRIIGEPGETVAVHNGKVYLNGKPIEENYIAELPAYELEPQLVPENQYFVMGDNRNDSNDSSKWGFLPKKNIIGRAVFRFWPPNRTGFL